MRFRFLIGAGGWLLGAAAATGGSMLAVSHLAHGLLEPTSQQLSATDVRNDLASDQQASANAARPEATPVRHSARPRHRAAVGPAPNRSPAPAGTLLMSRAGSAMATCQAGLAYIQYWSPAQGFQGDDVLRGPAVRASLVFEGAGTSWRMSIRCADGQPVASLAELTGDDGGGEGHDS